MSRFDAFSIRNAVLLVLTPLTLVGCDTIRQSRGDDAVGYVVGTPSAEDLIAIPATRWMISGGLKGADHPGALRLIDRLRKTAVQLFPAGDLRLSYDAGAYPTCPGPVDPADFSAHGIAFRPTSPGRGALFVVNHGSREAIEVFEIDLTTSARSVTWKGCIPMLRGGIANGVAALPGGGIVVSAWTAPDYFGGPTSIEKPDVWLPTLTSGKTTGHAATWRVGEGWRKVPGTEGSGPNGVEVSPDGRWVWMAKYGNREIIRAPLDSGGVVSTIKIDFLPDNLRWGSDGKLWTAGPIGTVADAFACTVKKGCSSAYTIVRIDPDTLSTEEVAHPTQLDHFGNVTTAVRVGEEVWLTALPADRVAYFR